MDGNSLIGTRFKPEGLDYISQIAKRAKAYHNLTPYPYFGFIDWKTEERGPVPKCLPFTQSIVKRGARWLFGKNLDIVVGKNDKLSQFINDTWSACRMPTKLVALAENAAQEGSYCIRFSIDPIKKKISFWCLSQIENVRLYCDPNERDTILMARVQYPYYDPLLGKLMMYREEWTDSKWVRYRPQEVKMVQSQVNNITYPFGMTPVMAGAGNQTPDSETIPWVVEKTQDNPYGVIPIVVIYNLEKNNSQWGFGDLWTLEPIIDRVNLTYHLMDKSNQFDSAPTPIYIDAVLEDDQINKPIQPNEVQSIKTDDVEGSGLQAKVELLEPAGRLRPYMESFAHSLVTMVHKAAGSVDVDPDTISNKGNLTQSVLTQIYGPLIETTEEKRRNYGDYGLIPLLHKLFYAMKKLGVWKGQFALSDDPDVSINWPDYFPLSDADIQVRLDRLVQQEQQGLITKDRVVRMLAEADGVTDIETFKRELENYESQIKPIPKPAGDGDPIPAAKSLAKPKQGAVTQ